MAEHVQKEGIRRDRIDEIAACIRDESEDDCQKTAHDELEDVRIRQEKLKDEVDILRTRLERSWRHIGLTKSQFRTTLSMSLRLAGAPEITETDPVLQNRAGRAGRKNPNDRATCRLRRRGPSPRGPMIITQSTIFGVGPYHIPNLRLEGIRTYTNNLPCRAFRGHGANQLAFAMVSQRDETADQNWDPQK